jgi:hypothetical protein
LIDAQPFVISLFSDHGQVEVIADRNHSIRLAFPFDRELDHFFSSLGLDVHDYPGEEPNCDVIAALNGGLAHIYLRHQQGNWKNRPDFFRQVLPVAGALWDANNHGLLTEDLKGKISGVLVRNVQQNGWTAPFQAVAPDKSIVSLENWFFGQDLDESQSSVGSYIDPVNRINNLVNPYVGDILLLSNYAGSCYFGSEVSGVHGGLHPDDSQAVMVFGFPGFNGEKTEKMKTAVSDAISRRCKIENNRKPSTADLWTGLLAAVREI